MGITFRSTIAVAGVAAVAAVVPALAPAATSQNPTQALTADVAATLEASVSAPSIAWGDLPVGGSGSETSGTVTVHSNLAWGVRVSTDAANGRMRVWNGSSYLAGELANALEWKVNTVGGVSQASTFADLSSAASTAVSGQAATTDSGRAVVVGYRQRLSYGDPPAGANDYRILVTYDAAQGY